MKTLTITYDVGYNYMLANILEDGHIVAQNNIENMASPAQAYRQTLAWAQEFFCPADRTDVTALLAMIEEGALTRTQEKILEAFQRYPMGLTAEEVSSIAEEDPKTARPRVTELYSYGFLIDTGVRRKTAAGRSARVFRPRNLNIQA